MAFEVHDLTEEERAMCERAWKRFLEMQYRPVWPPAPPPNRLIREDGLTPAQLERWSRIGLAVFLSLILASAVMSTAALVSFALEPSLDHGAWFVGSLFWVVAGCWLFVGDILKAARSGRDVSGSE